MIPFFGGFLLMFNCLCPFFDTDPVPKPRDPNPAKSFGSLRIRIHNATDNRVADVQPVNRRVIRGRTSSLIWVQSVESQSAGSSCQVVLSGFAANNLPEPETLKAELEARFGTPVLGLRDHHSLPSKLS
jgi:hypothetical protein